MPDIDHRREILAAYAAGDQIAQIVEDLGLPRGVVADTVDKLCQYDRARAAAAVDELGAEAAVADPDPDPPAGSAPALPDTPPGSFEDLLAAAYAAGVPAAAVKLADRIRRDVDELAAILAAARAEQAAQAKVDRLRVELAAAEEELAALTTHPATPAKRRGRTTTEQKGQP